MVTMTLASNFDFVQIFVIEIFLFFNVVSFELWEHLEMVLLKLIDLALVPGKKILLNLSMLTDRGLQMSSPLI